jgi:hypothetical protein
MSKSTSDRVLIAKIAAHTRWAQEQDRTQATEKARQAFADRFERQVDPDGVLPYVERQKRADSARRAYFVSLARKSAQARAAK